ncbi:MAG: hypothetical protein H0V17_33065 [Deltaproteobacteria bacterium]|nr:hypothetical protein [Deltaproteobacteria bacterium]
MSRLLALLIVTASVPAAADALSTEQRQPPVEDPIIRIGGTLGFQQTDRSAWVFGPSLEIRITSALAIRGDAMIEFGDFDDPFGDSNFRGGSGPHVNHVMFGPAWRPERYRSYRLAAGAQGGVMIMHSTFAAEPFAKKPAIGAFVQAGRRFGPIALALQLRVDVSAGIDMAGPVGDDVATTSGRFNLAFEFPIDVH